MPTRESGTSLPKQKEESCYGQGSANEEKGLSAGVWKGSKLEASSGEVLQHKDSVSEEGGEGEGSKEREKHAKNSTAREKGELDLGEVHAHQLQFSPLYSAASAEATLV